MLFQLLDMKVRSVTHTRLEFFGASVPFKDQLSIFLGRQLHKGIIYSISTIADQLNIEPAMGDAAAWRLQWQGAGRQAESVESKPWHAG